MYLIYTNRSRCLFFHLFCLTSPFGLHVYPPCNCLSSSGAAGRTTKDFGKYLSFPSTLALEECRSEGILGMVLQSWVPFVNYKLAPFFVFDKYKPHFVFHKLVPISSLVWSRGVSRCGSLASGEARNQSLQPRQVDRPAQYVLGG